MSKLQEVLQGDAEQTEGLERIAALANTPIFMLPRQLPEPSKPLRRAVLLEVPRNEDEALVGSRKPAFPHELPPQNFREGVDESVSAVGFTYRRSCTWLEKCSTTRGWSDNARVYVAGFIASDSTVKLQGTLLVQPQIRPLPQKVQPITPLGHEVWQLTQIRELQSSALRSLKRSLIGKAKRRSHLKIFSGVMPRFCSSSLSSVLTCG